MITVVAGGRIITQSEILDNKYLIIKDNLICDISDKLPAEFDKMIDASGKYISPGFVDLHLHGGENYDFNDATEEAFINISAAHAKYGTTSIMPTIVACSNTELTECIKSYKKVKNRHANISNMLGLHLEGPFISKNQAGAIDPQYLQIPNSEFMNILQDSINEIGRITIAPELPGAFELGQYCSNNKILVSIGHSDAEYPVVKTSVDYGFSHITHLFSAMSTVSRKNAYRVMGVLESAFLIDSLTVEIITDGKHLPKEFLEYIVKFKDNSKICLITDAMRGAGLPNGTHTILGSKENGREVVIKDDVAFMPDMSCFAGSTCTANRCIRTMYKTVGLDLLTSVKMMTYNPCRFLGIENQKGSIAPGMDADIVLFDDDISIYSVLINGKLSIYT